MRGNGAASVTPASSSRPLPVTQYTGRNWLNAETVESCEGFRCRPARSSADVCQRGAVHQCMGGGNTPIGVSPHPQGARLALRLVRQGDGLHYPVGQPLFGDSLPFLLTSVGDKELLRASEAPGAVHVECAMLLRDTAMLRLDLPPPRAVLAGSPSDRGRAWWEHRARIQAGVSRQRESRPAQTISQGPADRPEASSVPVRLCRGGPRSGKSAAGIGRTRGKQTGPPELGMESPLSGESELS